MRHYEAMAWLNVAIEGVMKEYASLAIILLCMTAAATIIWASQPKEVLLSKAEREIVYTMR
jgi:hypothetical protein